jgi:hypothetical protein
VYFKKDAGLVTGTLISLGRIVLPKSSFLSSLSENYLTEFTLALTTEYIGTPGGTIDITVDSLFLMPAGNVSMTRVGGTGTPVTLDVTYGESPSGETGVSFTEPYADFEFRGTLELEPPGGIVVALYHWTSGGLGGSCQMTLDIHKKYNTFTIPPT